jgi:hypothetical protein
MAKKVKSTDPADIIGEAIFSAIKPLHKEGEKLRRGARSLRRRYYEPAPPRWSQKEIVFGVLPQAVENAGDLFSARDLYYATRPLCYQHYGWSEDTELKYGYFSQTLLTEYQERRGPIEGLWRDPRGHLHEPHTGKVLSLGTLEVATYDFPPYTFDKVLYVEKEGEMPKLKAAELAERYDMAIVSGKGYPAEAVRTLFERAEEGDYQLFVFHDADIDGYNIARVMREATRRMPGYSVEVVDIGLTVEDALEMSLDSEPFGRKKRLPWMLYRKLSDVAVEYFTRRHERFELNAILPNTRRIEYIEEKLAENGVRGKVIPPDDKLGELAEEKYRDLSAGWVADAIEDLVSAEDLKKEIADEFAERFGLSEARQYIEDHFEDDRAASWRDALEKKLEAIRDEHADAFKAAVEEKLRERLDGEAP